MLIKDDNMAIYNGKIWATKNLNFLMLKQIMMHQLSKVENSVNEKLKKASK